MITGKYTEGYEILENDTVLLPSKVSNLRLHFKFEEFEFDFQMQFIVNEENPEEKLKLKIEGTLIRVECTNFNNPLGTGTIEPIEIATIDGKKLFIHFWSYLLGNNEDKKQKTRRIEYTVLIER